MPVVIDLATMIDDPVEPVFDLAHKHFFRPSSSGTAMRDLFTFETPLGVVGRAVDFFVLERHMRSFLIDRNRFLKATAESDAWRSYLPEAHDGGSS